MLLRNVFGIIVAILCAYSQARAESLCHGLLFRDMLARKAERERVRFLKTRQQEIAVTRYYDLRQFTSAEHTGWVREGDRFVPINRNEISAANEADISVMSAQQLFPMKKMVDTGYLTQEQAAAYADSVFNLKKAQIAFLESTRTVPQEWAARNYSESYYDVVDRNFDRQYNEGLVPLRTASLWSVAGQIFDPRAGLIAAVPMPWELEPQLAKISAQKLDRAKYRYVWEWGRAAQEIPGEHEKLRPLMTALNYQELKAMNGKIEDAYVMYHSLDQTNTNLYLKAFPESGFPKERNQPNDALFLVPLSEMIKKYPPSSASKKLKALIDASGGKLSETQAIDLHNEFRLAIWEELDFKISGQKLQNTPLVMRDYSQGLQFRLAQIFRRYGIEPYGPEISEYLRIQVPSFHNWNDGKYTDVTDPQVMAYEMRARNAVDVSNLNLKEAQADPKYSLRVLFSLFIYYAHRLAGPLADKPKVDHAVAMMRGENVRFSVTTWEPKISEQLRQYGPEYFTRQDPAPPDGPAPVLMGREWWTNIHVKPIRVHTFEADDVIRLMNRYPEEFQQAWGALFPARWNGAYLLADLDLF